MILKESKGVYHLDGIQRDNDLDVIKRGNDLDGLKRFNDSDGIKMGLCLRLSLIIPAFGSIKIVTFL